MIWPPEDIWSGKSLSTTPSPLLRPFALCRAPSSSVAQRLGHADIENVTEPTQLVDYYTTSAVPLHPLPGIIILSVVVSVLGSYAALLVLGRRTASRGWRNHVFLGLAAICFGAVAIWGMHFVR